VHKLRNLIAVLPKHAHEQFNDDYRRIVIAFSLAEVREAYKRFVEKWRTLSKGVVESLEEAGSELLTFYYFPKTQWKSLRSTNVTACPCRVCGIGPSLRSGCNRLDYSASLVLRCYEKITGYENMPNSLPSGVDKAA